MEGNVSVRTVYDFLMEELVHLKLDITCYVNTFFSFHLSTQIMPTTLL